MKTINRLASFIRADHRYVYLGTSVIAALGLAFSQRNPTPLSFLAPTGVFQDCLWAILWAWLVVSAAALVTKLMHWNDYREKSPFASERFRRGARLGSYVVVAIAAIFFVDRCVMSFIDLVQVSIVSDSNPSDFLSSLVYMTYKSGDFFIRGIEITIALATFGTVIAFFLALLFVFLRIQTFDRVDNDLVRFFKSIGRGFATIYSTIVRGTPMMVPGPTHLLRGLHRFARHGLRDRPGQPDLEYLHRRPRHHLAQLHRLHDGGPARRHRVHRSRSGRGGALAGSFAVAGYAQGRVPPGH